MIGLGNDCLYPYYIRTDAKNFLRVACGHCLACRKKQTLEWSVRLLLESKSWHDVVTHATLTYNEQNLPFYDVSKSLYSDGSCGTFSLPILVKKDVQDFFKRLRKNSGRKFRYYVCGEYGPQTQRSHYHAIIFGADSYSDRLLLQDTWKKGTVFCRPLFGSSTTMYVAQYVQKKLFKSSENEDIRPPEFAVMSRKPAIGWDYFYNCLWKTGSVSSDDFFIDISGYKYGVPRCFIRKLVDLGEVEKTRLDVLESKQLFDYKRLSKQLLSSGVTIDDFFAKRRTDFYLQSKKKALIYN